jgi:hypothetical protein
LSAQGALADIGKQAMPRLRSGLQLQRCPKNKKSYPLVNVSRLQAGPIREAVLKLSQSDEAIDRNTARQLAEGRVRAFYYEDLERPTDPIEGLLLGHGIADTSKFTIYLHPDSKEEMIVQTNFEGSRHGNDIFGSRTHPAEEWETLLVHETSHVVNPTPPVSNLLDKYKSEFRAYWVAQFRGVSNLDQRAKKVKRHILHDYSDIREAYNKNLDIKIAIDEHTRPDGDLTNVTGLGKAPPRPAGN